MRLLGFLGRGSSNRAAVDQTHGALRVSGRPTPVRSSFCFSATAGGALMAALRCTDPEIVCLLRSIWYGGTVIGNTPSGVFDGFVTCTMVRSFTAASCNIPTNFDGSSGRKSSRQALSSTQALAAATPSFPVVITGVQDLNPFGFARLPPSPAGGTGDAGSGYLWNRKEGDEPITFLKDEGFICSSVAAGSPSGAPSLVITMIWDEMRLKDFQNWAASR